MPNSTSMMVKAVTMMMEVMEEVETTERICLKSLFWFSKAFWGWDTNAGRDEKIVAAFGSLTFKFSKWNPKRWIETIIFSLLRVKADLSTSVRRLAAQCTSQSLNPVLVAWFRKSNNTAGSLVMIMFLSACIGIISSFGYKCQRLNKNDQLSIRMQIRSLGFIVANFVLNICHPKVNH